MRLVTRSDFDGLICGVLLKEAEIIDSYKFVHPKDVQDGLVPIDENDVLANIPYWPGCGMWFDHHSSEEDSKMLLTNNFKGESRKEKSCARIIYDYFGGSEKFPNFEQMINAVDKSDSADLSIDEIKNPAGWTLLSFIMDPRTGLGRYRDYRISNYALMENLIEYCRTMHIDDILKLSDVMERITRYREHSKQYKQQIKNNSKIYGSCLVIDFRMIETPFCGNRFMEYALFPEQNISIRLMRGKNESTTVFAIGYSIINKTSKVNVGALCKKHGGGGHESVGTCQVESLCADEILNEMIIEINGKE